MKADRETAKVTAAVLTIITNPATPTNLYDKVQEWITEATTIKPPSGGDSLLGRWSNHPDTVAACVAWSQEADEKEEE